MTTDGGGWTLAAYLGAAGSTIPNGFFVEPIGVDKYDLGRGPIGDDYSLGIIDEMDDIEMIIVGNTPDILSAEELYTFIQFKYPMGNPTFNNSLIPHLDSIFEFRKKLSNTYAKGRLFTGYRHLFWMVQDMASRYQFYIGLSGNNGYYYSPSKRADRLWFYVR